MQYQKPETKNQKSNTSGRGNTSTIENQKSSFNAKSPKLLEKLQNDKKLLNPPKKSKKKTLILLIILCVIVGGFFCWWKSGEIKQYVSRKLAIMESPYSPPEQFAIKDVDGKTLIQNKKQEFSAMAESGWTVNIEEGTEWVTGIVSCLSPNFEWDYENHFLMSGCLITVRIMKNDKDMVFDTKYVKAKISEVKHYGNEAVILDNFPEYRIIEVDYRETLKEIMNYSEAWIDKFGMNQKISISIPEQNKVYLIDSTFTRDSQEVCEKSLNRFLETVSID